MDKRSIYYKYFWQKSVAIVNKGACLVEVARIALFKSLRLS